MEIDFKVKERKLLIAPWGNPWGWKKVTYKFNESEVISCTSLKIIQEKVNPDKTIIIGLDTLAEKGDNYQEVKEDAKKKIEKYANEFGLTNCGVLIAPGIGTFPNGTFYGDALDYYYYIIAKISSILLEDNENTINLHLDLTHGLNYATILTYRAIREILEIFSMFKKVEFKAYNADPSLPTVTNELSINIIEDSYPVPTPLTEKFGRGRLLEGVNLSDKEREELGKTLRSITNIDNSEISAFIGALYNGLPLALFSFYPDANKLKDIIFSILDYHEKYIKVENADKLKVTRRVKFGKEFKVYVFAYVIASLLKNLNLISSRKDEVAIDEIEKLNKGLFKFDERLQNRIENDIYNLKKDLKGRDIEGWKVLNDVLKGSIGEPDQRNFLAHSGFEKNIIEVKEEDGMLMLRHRKERVETIINFCQKGLR